MKSSTPNWFTDETFWESTYPFMFPEARFAASAESISKLLELAGTAPDAHVLDLACGPGRFAVPLAQIGDSVTGVDRSPFLLGKAREYASRTGAQV